MRNNAILSNLIHNYHRYSNQIKIHLIELDYALYLSNNPILYFPK